MSYYGGDLTAILSPSESGTVWGWMDRFSGPEGQLVPGLTIVLHLTAGVGVRDIVVNREADGDGRSTRFVSGFAGASRVTEPRDEILYRLSAAPPSVFPAATGVALPIVDVSANVNADDVHWSVADLNLLDPR